MVIIFCYCFFFVGCDFDISIFIDFVYSFSLGISAHEEDTTSELHSSTNSVTSKVPEVYEVVIDGKKVDVLKIVDILVRFSEIDWKMYETKFVNNKGLTQTMETLPQEIAI